MKTKHLLFTASIFAGLLSGAVLTTHTANAQATNQTITQQKHIDSIEISSVHFKHYNVLRANLNAPLSTTDYYLDLSQGTANSATSIDDKIVKAAVENGKYVGFDFNLDELVKKYPTASDRENFFDSLGFRCFSLDGSGFKLTPKVTNQQLKTEFLRYNFLGNIINKGLAKEVTNITRESSFNTFFNKERVSGDSILENGFISTETQGLQFTLNRKFETGYTFSVTDESGKTSGRAWAIQDHFFVNSPNGTTFLPQEYRVTAKSNQTGEVYNLATFTPFNVF
ncbi:hypothetical protein [Candidatus Enterococcus mansonii]|uniref:WxL domain-containing protein n=1 Tax=Candidatus Enterococcus mansonii TaxID=1834181 RepID=A0A242CDX8_9ENTE|nr:hypothetical protein [Enterococcus sp. 4G2_DIV0659]OTO07982.1 hypothetical protein A5880_002252 [Enterococcus sp. 4G2_DIV0659]